MTFVRKGDDKRGEGMATRRFVVALLAVVTGALVVPQLAAAITYTVTRADDSDGSCPTPDDCSLRQAINSANATPGSDRIVFLIPPGGPQTIRPIGRNLPQVTSPVEI